MKHLQTSLDCFAAVSETLNISEAAKRLGISQPSASRHIRQLEEELGVDLFTRDNTGVRLTETGRLLSASVVPLLHQLEAALASARGDRDRVDGEIRFGCLTEIGQSHYLQRLLRFRHDYPRVALAVEYLKEHEIVRRLREGELDAGVITDEAPGEPLCTWPALVERAVLVSRASFEVEVAREQDLAEAQFVRYREDDPLLAAWLRGAFGAYASQRLQVAFTVNSHRSMAEALLAMDAVAVMPWHSIAGLVDARLLRVASAHELSGRLFLAMPRAEHESRRVRIFREHLLRA